MKLNLQYLYNSKMKLIILSIISIMLVFGALYFVIRNSILNEVETMVSDIKLQGETEKLKNSEETKSRLETTMSETPKLGMYLAENNQTKQEFQGEECGIDCSGHIAGFVWAASFSVSEDSKCISTNKAFESGCRAYVDEFKIDNNVIR